MNLRSLRVSLILPYVLLVALVAAALGGVSYWTTSRHIGVFSHQYMQAVAARIVQAVRFHVHGSASVLDAAFPAGAPAPTDLSNDLDNLRMRFWVATSMFTNPNNYVYYGNEAGQSIGLKRLDDRTVELRLKLRPELHRFYYRYQEIKGKPRLLQREPGLFDPRERVWYQLAQQTSGQIWTTVYIDFSSEDLVVTRARRVLGEDGEFQGVVATDVSLREINRFISSLDIGDQGRAFVVERDGKLIAATGFNNLGISVEGKPMRVSAANSDDPVIQAAYEGIARMIGQSRADSRLDDDREYRAVVRDSRGDTIAVAARRVVDDAGMDWLAIVAMPRDAIFLGIRQQLGLALSVGLLAVLLTILIGTRIFGRIAHEIISLSQAVDRIRSGDTSAAIATRRQDELGDLARNFSAMQVDLFTDRLTGAANRAALDSLLTRLITDRLKTPFALFFIDLNDFKPLNDEFGHDNGDRALIEVAARLKASLRSQDLVARLGGDEFIVIARDISSAGVAAELKGKLQASIEAPLQTLEDIPPGRDVRLGAAIGAACWPTDALDAEGLIKFADTGMYRDKSAKRRS